MVDIDRRSFLRLLSAIAVFPKLASGSTMKGLGRPAPKLPAGVRGTLIQGVSGRINITSLSTGKSDFIPVDLRNSHSVVLQPGSEHRAAAVDLDHGKCAIVDLRRRAVIATLEPEKGYWLSGHGCFSPDGKRFYLAETPEDFVAGGRVNVFDTERWTSMAKFPSGHAQTHMILPLQDGKVLAVGHYGTLVRRNMEVTHDGPLVYMDSSTGKIIREVAPYNSAHGMCHMDKTSKDELVVSTRSFRWKSKSGPWVRDIHFPSPILFLSAGGEKLEEAMPGQLADEMRFNFTVKVHEPSNRVLVCHLMGNRLSAWGLNDRKLKLVKSFGDEHPLGIGVIPNTDFFVLTTSANKAYVLEPKGLAVVHAYDLSRSGIACGAHFDLSPEEFVT